MHEERDVFAGVDGGGVRCRCGDGAGAGGIYGRLQGWHVHECGDEGWRLSRAQGCEGLVYGDGWGDDGREVRGCGACTDGDDAGDEDGGGSLNADGDGTGTEERTDGGRTGTDTDGCEGEPRWIGQAESGGDGGGADAGSGWRAGDGVGEFVEQGVPLPGQRLLRQD